MESKHLMYVPFTGLGNYNGFRGNRWLKNRIQIFKQFVIPSLRAQTCQDFILWISWRPEEKNNKHVKELFEWLAKNYSNSYIFTYHGVCFYDDKYEDSIARQRLINNLHYSALDLNDMIGGCENVLMTIQPSDDLYANDTIWKIQRAFKNDDKLQGVGFSKGYIINYWNKEVAEYNPTTNPPFYTIKFPTKIFLNPLEHVRYTSTKHQVSKYATGTPLPSHEYVKDCVNYKQIDERGFMVGTHKENISTTWQIPFKGQNLGMDGDILQKFGINDVAVLNIKVATRKRIYFALPYKAQRKIRYWMTEKFKIKNPLKKLWFWRNYTTGQHKKWWQNRKIDWSKEYLSTWNHPHRQVIRLILEKYNWMSLMEIGCGAGANLVQIARGIKGRKFQLGGTDINPEAIKVAENNGAFKGGVYFVCSNDDIMMSDKSADILLSDMNLIYTGPGNIVKTLNEFKRVARNYVMLCEFDSTSWWERFKLKVSTGYNAYDYKQLLSKNGFYDIVKIKLNKEHWPESKTQNKFAHIIIAKVPKYV